MRIQDIQYLSIWEIGHRWAEIDPAQKGTISVISKLGERLRQLIWVASHAINCYDIHGEQMPMETLWLGFPKTNLAKQLDVAFHDPGAHREFLMTVFLSQDELKKTFRGMEAVNGVSVTFSVYVKLTLPPFTFI